MEETKVCKKCGEEKSIYKYALRSDTGTRRGVCISCKNERQALLGKLRRRGLYGGKEFVPDPSKVKPWNRADVIYISKNLNQYVASAPVYKFCKWCTKECKIADSGENLYNLGYCSEWCREIDNPPIAIHHCVNCGNTVNAYISRTGSKKAGQSTGTYAKHCEECIKVGIHKWRGGRNKKSNEIIRNTTRVVNKSTSSQGR